MKLKKIVLVVVFLLLGVSLTGCDAFVRKFTRKPKKDNIRREEMVLAPEEYKPTMTKEQQYRQYLLFWESWQEELIQSLLQKKSQKKNIDCAEQAIKNLLNMKALLDEKMQKKITVYINQMIDLQASLKDDTYGTDSMNNMHRAENLKRYILREFSFDKIKKSLIPSTEAPVAKAG